MIKALTKHLAEHSTDLGSYFHILHDRFIDLKQFEHLRQLYELFQRQKYLFQLSENIFAE